MTKNSKLIISFLWLHIFCIGKNYSQSQDIKGSSEIAKIDRTDKELRGVELTDETIIQKQTNKDRLQFLFLNNLWNKLHSKKPKDTGVTMPADTVASEPFAFGDFSWLNGTSRKTSPPAFDSKYFTGDVTFDLNYTHSYNNPIDNTVVGSTALARNNELQLSFMGVGGDI